MRYFKLLHKFDAKFSFLLMVGILLVGMSAVALNTQTTLTTNSKASGPVCDDRCVHELPCCQDIVKSDDPYKCGWPDRGWCFQSTCAPYTGQHTNCGWYWRFHDANANQYHIGTNTPEGYGCMIGPDENSMRPICGGGGGPQPTVGSRPTSPPNPRPTRVVSTPTPYYIPVTTTPEPMVTQGENPPPVIIYVTATPIPEEAPPNYVDNNLVPTSAPTISLSQSKPNTLSNLNNILVSVSNPLRDFVQSIKDFLTKIAP